MATAFDIDIQMKKFFFDRPAVQKMIKDKERKPIEDALRVIRKQARQNVKRYVKKRSPRGGPPYTRTKGDDNLKKILYLYDPRKRVGIVGPIKLNKKSRDARGNQIKPTLPAFLEFGGSAAIEEFQWLDTKANVVIRKWQQYHTLETAQRRSYRSVARRVRQATYEPKPFMYPALLHADAQGKILASWKNVLNR